MRKNLVHAFDQPSVNVKQISENIIASLVQKIRHTLRHDKTYDKNNSFHRHVLTACDPYNVVLE